MLCCSTPIPAVSSRRDPSLNRHFNFGSDTDRRVDNNIHIWARNILNRRNDDGERDLAGHFDDLHDDYFDGCNDYLYADFLCYRDSSSSQRPNRYHVSLLGHDLTYDSILQRSLYLSTVTTHAAALYKRAAATNLGKLYPGCPKALANVALKVASTACSCFLGPVVTPTSTFASVTTSTLRITLNSISTETAVIPSSTTTITQTVTETSIVLIESFITQTSTDASTISAVASTTITSTITPPAPTATETITITNRYQVVTGPKRTAPGCTYNRYVDFPSVGNDPGPNNDYSGPINECKSLCDRRADCKFALYLRFDPATARGFDGGACILDNEPYDQSFLQCSYPVQFYAGWNRL